LAQGSVLSLFDPRCLRSERLVGFASTMTIATDSPILPITELSSYHMKWVIKARVTNRAPLRLFKRGSGDGKVFHVDLLDAAGGEIRASFFNEAADAYLNVLTVGGCYLFSRGSVRVANKQFNTTNHRYELSFDSNAMIQEASEDATISAVKFNFSDLRVVQGKTTPCRVDLCGVVSAFGPCTAFTSKDGKDLVKRDITLVDDTATSLQLTLWGDRAKTDDAKFQGHPVVALKSVFVKEWNGGRSGSILESGALVFQPEGPEAKRIQHWWTQGGSTQSIAALSISGAGGGARARNAKPCSLSEMRQLAEQLVSDQPENYRVVTRLALVQTTKQGEKQPLHYMACAEPREGSSLLCNRRVDERGFCAACNRAGKTAVRLNARCRFADYEDSMWLTTFHEAAEKVLGMSGDELRTLDDGASDRGEGGRENLEAAIRARYFSEPMQLIARAKLDTYNGDTRTNVTCIEAVPVNRADHGREMLKNIQSMLAA